MKPKVKNESKHVENVLLALNSKIQADLEYYELLAVSTPNMYLGERKILLDIRTLLQTALTIDNEQ